METTIESNYVVAHRDFWQAIADKYKAKGTLKGQFIGNIILDWLYDVNCALDSLSEETVIYTWETQEAYDDFLLTSMLNAKFIIDQCKTIYKNNLHEIKKDLGDDDPEYVCDYTADYYFTTGIAIEPVSDTVAS